MSNDAWIRARGWTVGRGGTREFVGRLGRFDVMGRLERSGACTLEIATPFDSVSIEAREPTMRRGFFARYRVAGEETEVALLAASSLGATLLAGDALGVEVGLAGATLTVRIAPGMSGATIGSWLDGLARALGAVESLAFELRVDPRALERALSSRVLARSLADADRRAVLCGLVAVDASAAVLAAAQSAAAAADSPALRVWAAEHGEPERCVATGLALAADGAAPVALRVRGLAAAAARVEPRAVAVSDAIAAFLGSDSPALWVGAAEAALAIRDVGAAAALGRRAALAEAADAVAIARALAALAAASAGRSGRAVGRAAARAVHREPEVALGVIAALEAQAVVGALPELREAAQRHASRAVRAAAARVAAVLGAL